MRLLKRIGLALVAVVLLMLAVLYSGSEWVLRSGYAVAAQPIAVPRDGASVTEGARLGRVFGCRDCHGQQGQGNVLAEGPMLGRFAPPALARAAAGYTDAELARAIRHGVRKDGTSLWIMPAKAYGHIADDDMGKLIAWIRTLRPSDKDMVEPTRFGPIARMLVLTGAVHPSARTEAVSPTACPADIGRYFVETSCLGCHALDRAQPSDDGKQVVPPLAPMAASYDYPAFRTLLQTGVGLGKRDLGLMRVAALGGYKDTLSEPEMVAIHEWLKAEAAR